MRGNLHVWFRGKLEGAVLNEVEWLIVKAMKFVF
jgi:hypothetical protein